MYFTYTFYTTVTETIKPYERCKRRQIDIQTHNPKQTANAMVKIKTKTDEKTNSCTPNTT